MEHHSSTRLESVAFFIFAAAIFLSPLIFWPSPFIPLNLVKTIVIVLPTLAAAILCGVIAIKEKKLALPPKSIFWPSLLVSAVAVISALKSINAMKSLFGQGFEIGTAGFILALFVSALVAFTFVARRAERAVAIYMAMAAAFLILYLFHVLRIWLGADFASFSILPALTSSVIGNWYSLGIFSIVMAVISIAAISVLSLSPLMRFVYWILLALGALGAVLIAPPVIWQAAFVLLAGLSISMYALRKKSDTRMLPWYRHIAWLPVAAALVALILSSPKGAAIVAPSVEKLYGGYSELALPWQMTLDVTAGAIKTFPLLGVGPNLFGQAFLAFKPAAINLSNAWGVEFTSGFGLIPTFVAEHGLIGAILWIIFFVFFGAAGVKALGKRLPVDPGARFIMISSYASAAFLFLVSLVYVPAHALVFLAFVCAGIFFGAARAFDSLPEYSYASRPGTVSGRLVPIVLIVAMVAALAWGLMSVRKGAALALFGSGVKQLSIAGNPELADSYFKKALAIDTSDVYWQARAEASLAKAVRLAQTVTASTPPAAAQAVYDQVVSAVGQARDFSKNAIAYDPTNYYNYVSAARAGETAMSFKVARGYEDAAEAYVEAIKRNPMNPSLYLSLARLQAGANKLDDALQSLGASLNVKNNYLDAIYILSQVYAAKGNLPQAITAAQVALELNPRDPLLHFQLGLLKYNSKDYEGAAKSMAEAVKLQGDYANARYFLGLADARLNKTAEAIKEFAALKESNPDNQEISLILSNLRAGKPVFADAAPPITQTPEKRATLPIPEKRK